LKTVYMGQNAVPRTPLAELRLTALPQTT